ncbi:AMP-binding enzyme family protein (macronuclear) [Tetrahymena thermophila SB210]|uniref:AMP-binding enzyme family protein n=1 Tax=Tetrahymena thermophila (strain SB210) TaxID=312017 RepID=I7M3W1_TETTS|nr:AMP-binding enzyme family protein [Tetrahymena thermophila SB210]EAS04402.2 AMP-binding enzyme family protein [Tetrahymena thermophila SB210]|eukprot:XP_001024647.2 AMP-binding enzyme family protein [Tetrahymena thermophila SB210]
MLLSIIKSIDIFSQTFQFNSKKQKLRKRTLIGSLLTISIISITVLYLIQLLQQFANNQIDPTFKNQTFISKNEINVELKNDYFAYQLSQNGLNPIDQVQKEQNKTYVVAIAQFVYQDNSGQKSWRLKTFQCQDPKLAGYNCLDFSNVPSNYTIALDNSQNIYSYVMVSLYKCQDTDIRKTFVPDNCASLEKINAYLNSPATYLKVQIQVSQFNTTNKQIETCYRSQILLVSTSNIAISEIKLQQQSTTVKQGSILQTQETFNSPISYTVNTQMFDPKTIQNVIGLSYFTQFHINLDEFKQYTSIQYPTLPQILAQCNSAFTLLMCLGIIGSMFQDNYSLILGKENNLGDEEESQNKSQIQESQHFNEEDFQENVSGSVYIPSFKSKQFDNLSQFSRVKGQGRDAFQESTNTKIQQIALVNSQTNQEERMKEISPFSQSNNNKKQFNSCKLNLNSTFASYLTKQNSLRINEEEFFQQFNEELNKTQLQKNSSLFLQETKAFRIGQDQKDVQRKVKNKQQNKIDLIMQELGIESASKIIKDKLYKFKLCKKDAYLKSLGLEKQDLQFIDQQVDNITDYSKIVEELMFLKKAVMVILSKDQLASLQLVGCSRNFINHLQNKTNQDIKMSYFEEQLAISLQIEQQSQLIKQFIKKCQTQNNMSTIDKRIYSSLT